MNTETPFVILWIEDEFLALKDGVSLVNELLEKHLNQPVVIKEALWLDAAFALLEQLKDNPPDVIILDIMLPRTEKDFKADRPVVDYNAGFLLWRRLRRHYSGHPIGTKPILVLAARDRPEFRSAMTGGGDNLRWLGKPAAPSEIVRELLQLCGISAGDSVKKDSAL